MKDDKIPAPRMERRDAAENRLRILDAAQRLFDGHGVENVSMNQIAIEAGIGPGTLYRRYRNKSELCLDLIKDTVVLLFEEMESFLELHASAPPRERLQGVLALFLRFREKKVQLLAGVENPASSGRGFQARAASPLYEELHGLLVRLLDEMAAAGQHQPDSIFTADLLLTALSSDFYLFQKKTRGMSSETFLEQLFLSFLGVNAG
ncbi:TetR/AcrR family transcriptional regulator [Paenibacillus humicus]|uniref:TetR/AcrR family transcriptional regulator n=1 Tax=Paenibacillus humicus TaxID=412861 RepID=UPI003F13CDEA